VLRAAGETEITQENIQDRLELGEGGPGFQLLAEEEIAAVIYFFIVFSSAPPILLNCPYICFLCSCPLGLYFFSLTRIIA
jgi:hypothetical protein